MFNTSKFTPFLGNLFVGLSEFRFDEDFKIYAVFRKPLCNGNGAKSSNGGKAVAEPVVGDDESGTPSGSLTPNNDEAQTPSINETPLSLRRVSSSKAPPGDKKKMRHK